MPRSVIVLSLMMSYHDDNETTSAEGRDEGSIRKYSMI